MPFRFRPSRRRLPGPDRFFQEGDLQRQLRLRALREALAREQRPEEQESGAFGCPVCGRLFPSAAALERHHQSRHRLCCRLCARTAPSAHLLSLHLLERHRDPLFALQSRRSPAFRCLLESCAQSFWSSGARRAHLEHFHRFPPDFRFLEPLRDPDSSPEPGGPPQMCAVEDMETTETGAAEDHGSPLRGASSASPTGHGWRYRARIPPTICFGEGAPCFRVQNQNP